MNAKTWIGHMDLAEDPEIRRCWDMNPKTWILQRTLRYKDAETWIGDMDLAEDPEIHTDPETWILQRFLRYMWMLRHESGNMDLAEDPEIHMNAHIWIRRHGSCRGSWDTYGCWDMNPETDLAEVPEIHMDAETWIRRQILQRILRVTYFWVLIYGSGDMGACDSTMLRHESEDMDLAGTLRYIDAETWIGDMDLAEDPEIHMAAELWIRQHGSCRGPWDTHGCWDMNPETWILQRSLRHKDVETWIRRCGSCSSSSLVDATTWIGDMTPAEALEIRSVQKTQTFVL